MVGVGVLKLLGVHDEVLGAAVEPMADRMS